MMSCMRPREQKPNMKTPPRDILNLKHQPDSEDEAALKTYPNPLFNRRPPPVRLETEEQFFVPFLDPNDPQFDAEMTDWQEIDFD